MIFDRKYGDAIVETNIIPIFLKSKCRVKFCLTTINLCNHYFCFMKFISLPVMAFVLMIAGCTNNDSNSTPSETGTENTTPALTYSIVAAYPHDTSSYTEGLLFYKGELYESTGNYGFSKL